MDNPTSNTNLSGSFTSIPFFANFTVLSMEFPITNCLPFFYQTDGNFYQIFSQCISGQSVYHFMTVHPKIIERSVNKLPGDTATRRGTLLTVSVL